MKKLGIQSTFCKSLKGILLDCFKAFIKCHIKFSKATITRWDLSARFFCIDATFCANLKAIRYELFEFE